MTRGLGENPRFCPTQLSSLVSSHAVSPGPCWNQSLQANLDRFLGPLTRTESGSVMSELSVLQALLTAGSPSTRENPVVSDSCCRSLRPSHFTFTAQCKSASCLRDLHYMTLEKEVNAPAVANLEPTTKIACMTECYEQQAKGEHCPRYGTCSKQEVILHVALATT